MSYTRIMLLLIETVSGVIATFPFFVILHFIYRNYKLSHKHRAGVLLYSVFVIGVLSVTGIPSVYNINFEATVSMIPLYDILENYSQYFLNMILFVPLGFLLPVLWKRFQKLNKTVVFGFIFSLTIEISQLFCFRTTDIDDLIMNTAGAFVGYIIFYILGKKNIKLFEKFELPDIINNKLLKNEAIVYLSAVWLSMILIQPFISSFIHR